MDLARQGEQAGERAERSTWLDRVAAAGVVTYGVVHLIVAWLVLRLAFGDSGGSASGSGAFHQLAQTGVGQASLYGVAAGFFALAVWQAVEAGFGFRHDSARERLLKRLLAAGKVVLWGGIGVDALLVASGSSGGGGGTDGPTARLMRLPAGVLLVGVVGVAIVAGGCVLAYYGVAENFRDTMSLEGDTGATGRSYVWLGKLGYVSKGLAVALVGLLFGYAALTHDPDKSGGLDQALRAVQQQPYGAPVLVLVAAGLACFGLFCFAWARHLDR